MANTKISGLNSLTKATVATNDVVPIVDTGSTETKKMTYQELIQPQDDNFRIAGSSDNTKLAAFEVDGLTTGTTRTYTLQDSSDTLVGLATTDTLTNKTLTSPVINVTSDATGDMYYRNSGGLYTRLAIGTNAQQLSVSSGGIPEWIANADTSDATTTTRGVVELATQVEYDARDDSGTSSATNVVHPAIMRGILYHDYALDAAGSDTYAITVTPAPAAYTNGDVYTFEAGTLNTGAATLNVNTLGAKALNKKGDQALVTGDIEAGLIIVCVYDGTVMQIVSQLSSEAVSYTNGDTTKALGDASATQTIAHGLGVVPKKVKLRASLLSSASGQTFSWAETVYNGTTQSSQHWKETGTNLWAMGNNFSINFTTGGSADYTGVVTFDATNISIAWTKAGSPAGTMSILWEAEA
jgi:hypothetical protein